MRIRNSDSARLILINLGVACVPIALISFLLGSYFGTLPSFGLVLSPVDGWCLPTEAFGSHCFGDFGFPRSFGGDSHPFTVDNGAASNTPLTLVVLGGFRLLPYQLGYMIYVASIVVLACYPLVRYSRGLSSTHRIVAVSVFGVGSIGILSTIDRGNAAAVIAPLAVCLVLSTRSAVLVIAGALALSLKFWAPLLLLILLARRRHREALGAIVLGAAISFLALLALPGPSILEKMTATLDQVTNRDFGNVASNFAVSLQSVMKRGLCLSGHFDLCPTMASGKVFPPLWLTLSLTLLVAVVGVALARNISLPLSLRFSPLLAMTFLVVPEAAVYNLALVICIVTLFLVDRNQMIRGLWAQSAMALLIAAVLVSSIPISWSGQLTPWLDTQRFTYWVVPLAWAAFVLACVPLVSFARRVGARKSDQNTSLQ